MISSIQWYGRYINYLLFVWKSDIAEISEFNRYLNNNCFGLSFTIAYYPCIVKFLDFWKVNVGNFVKTCIYCKPKTGNTILHARSCHNKHIIKDVPVGEMLCARRNCSMSNNFLKEAKNISDRLLEHQCPRWSLDRARSIAT